MPAPPTLHLIAGVNGAGKTSFYRYQLEDVTPGAEFVNADEMARRLWPGREAEHVVQAANLAAERRARLIDEGKTFVAETVFSHESKLALVQHARACGYRVILYHVGVSSAELASARIATRVGQGGHDVPVDTVAARYERTQALIPRAAAVADMTFIFDNSGRGSNRTHTHIMTLEAGRVAVLRGDVPRWVARAYAELLEEHRA